MTQQADVTTAETPSMGADATSNAVLHRRVISSLMAGRQAYLALQEERKAKERLQH